MSKSKEDGNWRANYTTAALEAILQSQRERKSADEAYLVVRLGVQWHDILQLRPSAVSTLGRDENNQIVLDDDRCSRWHCEVFFQDSCWVVRDRDSRNGTRVGSRVVEGDQGLIEGDVIRIGRSEILFTYDISQRLNLADAQGLSTEEEQDSKPKILKRSANSKFLSQSKSDSGPSIRTAFADLYEMVAQIVSSPSIPELASRVLDGILPASGADIGAVLLFPTECDDRDDPNELRIAAYRAPESTPYQKVSRGLSSIALRENEAVLALDVSAAVDSDEFESREGIGAQSVICAPLRHDGGMLGMIHLYSLRGKQLDTDALELSLAVADQTAVTLLNLNQRQVLAVGLEEAWDRNRSLQRQLEVESDLVGISQGMQELRHTIGRVARSDASVLIRGESGVGKELVARAVHFNSPRSEERLVCLNCAALSESLLESELFGHERGAFTGATDRSLGKFEQAHKGTLFLDEVGEMPLSIQSKFLRVLEGHPFERVGGSTSLEVDVRVVSATNRNLEEAVDAGEFRSDLFYRLQILEVVIPSLRERRDDIPLLADHFLARSCERLGTAKMQLAPDAQHRLTNYDWPGNIRELRNVIERTVVLNEGMEILAESIQIGQRLGREQSASELFQPTTLEELERRYIKRTLEWTGWKKRESARILGINRSTLDRKLERYGIRPE